MKIEFAGQTDLGKVRTENEDNWIACPDLGLYVVADGMGGHLGGGLASKIVVEVLPVMIRNAFKEMGDLASPDAADTLKSVLIELSVRLRDGSKEEPGLSGMGSTVILGLFRDDKILIGQMGDSRAYLLRRGKLKQLTADQSLVQLLIDSGDITPEEALIHPARGQITSYVGMEGEPLPEVQFLELRSGDKLLLCSDGLTGMLKNDEIETNLRKRVVVKTICRQFIDAANDAGGKDNIAVLTLRVTN